jgi:hypothetical protein
LIWLAIRASVPAPISLAADSWSSDLTRCRDSARLRRRVRDDIVCREAIWREAW